MKIACPGCHQHYEVDDTYIGRSVACHVCGKDIDVLKPVERVRLFEKFNFSAMSLKSKIYLFIFIALIFGIGIYWHTSYKRAEYLKYQEGRIREIMESALLDLVKYPASSKVTFKSFNFLRDQKCLMADGYIDFPNGFGVKSREKFSFSIRFPSDNPRMQWIFSKEELGNFWFGNLYIDAKKMFDFDSLRKDFSEKKSYTPAPRAPN